MKLVTGIFVALSVLVGGLAVAVAAAPAGQLLHDASPLTGSPGEQVYQKWCWNCHGPSEGRTRVPAATRALQNSYKDSDIPAVLDERTDLTPAIIRAFVRGGVYWMPPFRKTEVTDTELDALIEYLTRSNR